MLSSTGRTTTTITTTMAQFTPKIPAGLHNISTPTVASGPQRDQFYIP